MRQAIIGFDTDEHADWRARLACGHLQHVRHDPPLRSRKWVLTEDGRKTRIGAVLECLKCEMSAPRDFENS